MFSTFYVISEFNDDRHIRAHFDVTSVGKLRGLVVERHPCLGDVSERCYTFVQSVIVTHSGTTLNSN